MDIVGQKISGKLLGEVLAYFDSGRIRDHI